LIDLKLVERYKKIRVADVIDALDRYGFHDKVLVSNEIKPLYSGIMMAGYAVTVKANRIQDEIPFMTPEEYEKFAGEWYGKKANYEHFMKHAGPGVVLVVDLDECNDVGFWGSNIGLSAKVKGVEGIVLDGGCRDTYEVRKIQFPVFCRAIGRTEVIGRIEIKPENVKVPITVGGAYVNPSDIVVGDDDGVVIVPKKVATQVLERAEKQLELDRKGQKPFLDKTGITL
jgi:regulator of RNase E activity RraA